MKLVIEQNHGLPVSKQVRWRHGGLHELADRAALFNAGMTSWQ